MPQTARPLVDNQDFAPAREITPVENPVEDFEPVTSPTAQPAKSGAGGKILGVLVALIFIVAAFAGGLYVGKNWDSIFKPAPEKPVETPASDTRDLSAAEIKDLSNKVSYLMMANAGTENFTMDYYRFLPSVVNNALTDADKLEIAVYSLRNEYVVAEGSAESSIPAARVESRFKEIFGANPVYAEAVHCPGYKLSEDKTNYLIGSGCGGVTDNVDLLYKQDYYYKDGSAYVDIAVGSKFAALDDNTALNTIYNNYYAALNKAAYKAFADFASLEDFNNFVINADNASNFTRYSLRFDADTDGNFHYVNATILENAPTATTPTETTTPETPAAEPTDNTPAETTPAPSDDIGYETDPDAPACPRNNPYAICVD